MLLGNRYTNLDSERGPHPGAYEPFPFLTLQIQEAELVHPENQEDSLCAPKKLTTVNLSHSWRP